MIEETVLDNVDRKSRFLVNDAVDLTMMRGAKLSIQMVVDAVDRSHQTMRRFAEFDVDVFALLGMRNLSAFVGEVFAAQMIKASNGLFRKNPHQDGYPDLLLMDTAGTSAWEKLAAKLKKRPHLVHSQREELKSKQPVDRFPHQPNARELVLRSRIWEIRELIS